MNDSPMSFCISTFNNLEYLKIAVKSVRENSYFKDAPFIIHAENCEDGTDEWLDENYEEYGLQYVIEKNKEPKGIGGGMNFCAKLVQTEYINFLHSDMYVTEGWDKALLDVYEKYPDRNLGWVCSHRVEPKMFPNSTSRPGTIIVPKDSFGAYYDDFDAEWFERWASEFKKANDFEIPKAEGVSGLIRKEDWDLLGGNDPLFAPASWEDMDLFWRMKLSYYEFVLTSNSVVWHFGARGSHRLEENDGKSSQRQVKSEIVNKQKFYDKWGGYPTFDEYGMIDGIQT